MRNHSHEQSTLIGVIREHVVAWRRRERWSRESVVQVIVEEHAKAGFDDLTGIKFDPNTTDTVERMKVNADRVFRWLDDEGKDSNLLPANFIPSILAAMPLDLRMRCVDHILRPLGLAVTGRVDAGDQSLDALAHLGSLIKEGSEAQSALVRVAEGGDANDMERARAELLDVASATARAINGIDAAMAKKHNIS